MTPLQEILQRLDELEGEFIIFDYNFDTFREGARWAVARLRNCRSNGARRTPGEGRKKGGGK